MYILTRVHMLKARRLVRFSQLRCNICMYFTYHNERVYVIYITSRGIRVKDITNCHLINNIYDIRVANRSNYYKYTCAFYFAIYTEEKQDFTDSLDTLDVNRVNRNTQFREIFTLQQ